MSGKKVILLAALFFALMATVITFIVISVSGDNVNNQSAKKSINPNAVHTLSVKVEGMTCTACEPTISMMVNKLSGIISVKASYADTNAVVTYDTTQTSIAEILAAIKETGYKTVSHEDKKGSTAIEAKKITPIKIQSTMKCGAGKCGGGQK